MWEPQWKVSPGRRLLSGRNSAPSCPDIVASAQAAEGVGADAVTLVNTLSAMQVDLESRSIVLSGGFGACPGPRFTQLLLRAIFQVHTALPRLPVIGVGGN